MAKVLHTCTECVPIDASIIDTYVALVETNKRASTAEDEREVAEAARVSAEEERTRVFTADHGTAADDHTIAAADHSVAGDDHTIAVEDHRTAANDHSIAEDDHRTAGQDHQSVESAYQDATHAAIRAAAAAAAAEHMVDIHQGPEGPEGPAGVGFASVSSQQDGTMVIALTNGDTMTIDLNHNHPQYPKYVYLTSSSQMPATPDSETLYLILDNSNS